MNSDGYVAGRVSGSSVAVVGGGPAGLRAAEVAAAAGLRVTLFDAMPSVGRKFLVAGRGGMNITHEEPEALFLGRYRTTVDGSTSESEATWARWDSLLRGFDAAALRTWAAGLGVETFTASTGRVYPKTMKSAPLLRRWVERLRALGVVFRMRHRWVGMRFENHWKLAFESGSERLELGFDQVVLALGGASWPATGSTGGWTQILSGAGVRVHQLHPSNCGWECDWPAAVLEACEGQPLKNIGASAGSCSVRGELLVTRYGLEGGAVYALTAALRAQTTPALRIDFKPDSTLERLVSKMGSARRNFLQEAVQRWRLGDAVGALLRSLRADVDFDSAEEAARFVKDCRVFLKGPRPVEEAISSAGGVCFSELDEGLMVKRCSGLFVAGEMLDWEAPTGGYLLQGCFATGTRAGEAVVERSGRR